jgi:uncharacterized repeat protein (TIGR01451 family)
MSDIIGKAWIRTRVARFRATAVGSVLVMLGLLVPVIALTAQPASAADPQFVSFTLAGCNNDGSISLPNGSGDFICPDAAYTPGNLGKGWNELDLVPMRVTAKAGNQVANQTYTVGFVLDNCDGPTGTIYTCADGTSRSPGYDVISAPVKNAALSTSTCAVSTTSQQFAAPGVGGTAVSIYRMVTITQAASTTCVYDFYGRLALGSHLFPGSSLHFNMTDENLDTAGIGARDVSLPVNEILPQKLTKDMSASQAEDNVWSVTKSPTPAHLDFENTCGGTAGDLQQGVSLTVRWTKTPALGGITVITHVYATNPASRTITTNVTDVIYDANNTPLDSASSSTDVPANTTKLVLTHTTSVPADTSVPLHDIATGTYVDTVTGVAIPGSTTATASASPTITTTNATAVVTDSESISGTGLTFSVVAPSVGSFTNYSAGAHTTGPVNWTSGTQSGSGSVTFNKTVYLDQPRQTSGALADTATVTGSDGSTASASASVDIVSHAEVSLTINKSIPDVLQTLESQSFTFQILDSSNVLVDTETLTFGAGDTSKSVTVPGLAPGVYTVHEVPANHWNTLPDQTVDLRLPTCSGSASFRNSFTPARARAIKVTNPAGFEGGWTMTLTGPGGPEDAVTDAGGTVNFGTSLQEGTYTIAETPQPGWTPSDPPCTFTVDYPADAGRVFPCTFHNTYAPRISLTKRGDALSKIGDDVTYTITLTNTSAFGGPAGAPNLVCTVFDSEIGFTKPGVVLTPGGLPDVSIVPFTIPQGAPDPFPNTAHAICTVQGSNPTLNANADSNTVNVNLFQPGVTIRKTGPAYSKVGDTVTYHIVITNTSSSDAPPLDLASFSDSKVSGVTPPTSCSTLAFGASCSFDYTYVVQASDDSGSAGATLSNTASVLYHPRGFPNDIRSSDTWNVTLLHPSFTVNKVCTSTQPVSQNATSATFQVRFNNTGDADLVITADDGIGTFNLAAGAHTTFTVTVNGPFTGQASVDNTVHTTSVTLDRKYNLSNVLDNKSSSASCQVGGLAKVIKTVNGQPLVSGQSFTFQLRQGATTIDDGTILESQNATAANGGVINFATNLVPGQTYQLCEIVMPGWSTTLGTFVPGSFNPPDGTVPDPTVDNSILCGNFTVAAGATKVFTIDNSPPPGGRALTIGFWKNWASCAGSKGGQKPILDQTLAKAEPTGIVVSSSDQSNLGYPGFSAVFYLVLHGSTSTPNSAPSCLAAVRLLNKSTIGNATKKSSDVAFNLAAQLVAAELNYTAGAGKQPIVTTDITRSVRLLGKYQFDGNTHTNISAADTATMNCLAGALDDYNNDRPVRSC